MKICEIITTIAVFYNTCIVNSNTANEMQCVYHTKGLETIKATALVSLLQCQAAGHVLQSVPG